MIVAIFFVSDFRNVISSGILEKLWLCNVSVSECRLFGLMLGIF